MINFDLDVKKKGSKIHHRIVMGVALSMVVIGIVVLYLLTQATTNRSMYEKNYELLFKFTVVVVVVLSLIVVMVGIRLVTRLRQRRFGSRLLMKLAFVFALVGIAPGVLIYVVSYQFVERSIETWFDVKVEGALAAGLQLGRVSIDALSGDLGKKSWWLSQQIAQKSSIQTEVALSQWLDQLGVIDITIWSGSDQLLASAGSSKFQLAPQPPSISQMAMAKENKNFSWVDGLDDSEDIGQAKIKALSYIPNTSYSLNAQGRYVLITRYFPQELARNALMVERAYREYQERYLARSGLKQMYIGTLTLSLILAVFGAVLLAILLGDQIVQPLMLLADGMLQVASGDLRPKLVARGRDELGTLTRSFAMMTKQLSDARDSVENSMAQLDTTRGNLQTILDNISAGVMVLTPNGEIKSANPGAQKILCVGLPSYMGKALVEVPDLEKFGTEVQQFFTEFGQQKTSQDEVVDHWQRTIELNVDSAQNTSVFDKRQTLVVRGAKLPDASRLLVFDDITDIISAQRSQAWGEVARRLAHEIKNPLTPIRLSAERAWMKLEGKLHGTDQALLKKSVNTIVDQVDAMLHLVDEFRDYARLPSADLRPLDLNALVQDIAHLYAHTAYARIVLELDEHCPAVLGDAQQLRQVIHNLLQNAQDSSEAAARTDIGYDTIIVRTLHSNEGRQVRLLVLDYGTGFSDRLLHRAFEPYVTTKAKGTGLGLAVVRKIAEEHGGRIDIVNRFCDGEVIGAQASLTLATARINLV
jgi:nitrogen fixation/metabolism regulation signal transduction histidine kinase